MLKLLYFVVDGVKKRCYVPGRSKPESGRYVQEYLGGDQLQDVQGADAGQGNQGSGAVMPMIEHEQPAMHHLCEFAPLILVFIKEHPDGADRLREFLSGPGLWDTSDVCQYTGWGRTYISRLCSNGTLPYIPGRPNKFVPSAIRKALEQMQQGGAYGRRKSTTKGRK